MLANSEFRHELESDIDPFRGLLLGLFFMTVGAGINFTLLADNLAVIMGLSFGLIALKVAILFVLGRFFGVTGGDQILFALGLAQAGEFGFVLLSFSVANSVLPQAVADQLALIVAISMLLTPLLFVLYDKAIAPRFSRDQGREADTITHQSEIIIAGHGRFGGIINRLLRATGFTPVVVDYNSEQLQRLKAIDLEIYYGDATRPDLLKAAGIETAKLLVVAIDGKEQITELVKYVIKTYPHVHVLSRAVDRDHIYELWGLGCRDIIRETYDSSIRAARSALEAIGLPKEEAVHLAQLFEAADRRSVAELADLYDPDLSLDQNKPYADRIKELQEESERQLRGEWQSEEAG